MKPLAFALAAIAFASPALAQSGTKAPFSGPRVELHGGWNWLSTRTRSTDGTTTTRASDDINDGFFGGQVGYDYAIGGRSLVGVFGSYDLSNDKECAIAATTTGCFKTNRNIEAGARVGEVFGGSNLVYLKGAYVNGKFGASVTDESTNITVSDHEKRDGWRAGVGVEHQLGRYAYAKLEYNYSRYNRFHGAVGPDDVSVRPSRQEVLGGIGFRF